MKVSVLTSGAENAVLVVSSRGAFLIDAGTSPNSCARYLHSLGMRLSSVGECYITHSHDDHYRYAGAYQRKGVMVRGVGQDNTSRGVTSYQVPHDAKPPGTFGFLVQEGETALTVIIDSGSINSAMAEAMNRSDVIVIGCNYDDVMLEASQHYIKPRVQSNTGHLSNQQLARFIREDWSGRAHTFIVAHLSLTHHNTEELCEQSLMQALLDRNLIDVPRIILSLPRQPTPLVEVELKRS